MKLKEIRELLSIKKDEIIINKKLTIRDKELVILSLIKGEECNKFYVIQKNDGTRENEGIYSFLPSVDDDEMQYEEYEDIIKTNREELIHNINEAKNSEYIIFEEVIIQGKKITFESSTSSSFECLEAENVCMLNYFINAGMIPKEWDDLDIDNLILTTYIQSEDEDFPVVDYNENLSVELIVDECFREILIQKPFEIEVKKYDEKTKIEYVDEESEEVKYFYLDEVLKYDIWKEWLEKLELNLKQIDESKREEYENDCIFALECECSKDMDLLMLVYENEEEESLRFITKEYLDSESYCDGNITEVVFLDGNEKGINGYLKRSERLKSVPKDFNEKVEIELFSKYVKIPSEKIYLEV